jgi:SAM-dependent methyltransferase
MSHGFRGQSRSWRFQTVPATQDVPCPVCDSRSLRVLYPDTLKDGRLSLGYDFGPQHRLHFRVVACRDCSHVFASPRPTDIWRGYRETVDDAYLKNREDRVSTAEKVVREMRRVRAAGRLLDVGCATGDFLSVARRTYDAEGLEISEWAAQAARSGGNRVHQCTLEEAAAAGMRYDIVTLWGVIEHLEDPGAELAHIGRLLDHGGLVFVWTGDAASLPARLLGKRWWYVMGQHIQLFTRRSLVRLFAQNGFVLVRMSRYPYVMSLRSVAKSLMRYPLVGRLASRLLGGSALGRRTLTLKLPGEMLAVFRKR